MILFLWACVPNVGNIYRTCDLELTVTPASPVAGESVVFTGGPLSEPFDTSVRFDGEEGEVRAVDRLECGDCDECRTAEGCLTCGVCLECDDACAPCTESMEVVVPTTAVGSIAVGVVNRHGAAELVLDVLSGSDTDDDTDTDTDRP